MVTQAEKGAFLRAANEMGDRGTFAFADEAVSYRDITAMFDGNIDMHRRPTQTGL